MTTNEPEVVAFVDLHRGFGKRELTVARGVDRGRLEDGEQLIRLSDHESRMAVLFDGHAVYSAMTDKAKQHTSPESVAVVLDAVAKLMGEVTHG